ncbi:extracellular solute-binding protein [Lacticaseibacillus nasuensis]|uniref:extracellular solute-binding protein n=1 Tax=Lacticaseibacillus nasuensis TaxID=944671 RepID=UPI002247E078|nr:extracellular solute-binding protein [Lacticaseibacillus nasuensis]MCX2455063.1 extracellular solute-binding protein [Lacticaseibacillus nasuensis]
MHFKKITGLVMAALASTMVLAACGSKSSDSSSNKTLTFWYGGDKASDVTPLTKAFTKKTGIKVKVQAIPWANYNDKLLTAAASKNGPDILLAGTTAVSNYAQSKTLMDISKEVKSDSALSPSKYFDGSVATTKVKGKYYAVPWYVETRVLFYRKDLLKKVGYNEAPKNWDELYDASQKLAKIGKYGLYVDPDDNSFGYMFARQNGAQLMKGNQPNLNSKKVVESIEYLAKYTKNKITPKQNTQLSIGQTFGGDGKIEPMFISGPWMVKSIKDEAGLKDDQWDVTVLPTGSKNNMSLTGGGDLAVFNYSKNKKNAIKLLKFMSSRSSQLQYYKTSTSLPTLKSAWTDKSLSDRRIQVFRKQLNNAQPMPLIKQWDQIGVNYHNAWQEIGNGANVKKVMDEQQAKAKALINK